MDRTEFPTSDTDQELSVTLQRELIMRSEARRISNELVRSRLPDKDLINALAECYSEPNRARQFLTSLGFRCADIPQLDIPKVFWRRMCKEAQNGKIVGGVQAIVEAAHREYRGNTVFREILGFLSSPVRALPRRELSGSHDVSTCELSCSPRKKVVHIFGSRSCDHIKKVIEQEGYQIDSLDSLACALPHWQGSSPPASYELDIDKANTEFFLITVLSKYLDQDEKKIQEELQLARILGLTVIAIVEAGALQRIETTCKIHDKSTIVVSSLESEHLEESAGAELRRVLREQERRPVKNKEELSRWRSYIKRRRNKSSGREARAFLDFFPGADADLSSVRLFGRLTSGINGSHSEELLTHRFIGVKNCRADDAKWVWYAWDCIEHQRVVIKEISPDKDEQGKKRRFHWERTVFQRVTAVGVKGISGFIDGSCEGWFAIQYMPLGTVYWHGFRMPNHTMPIDEEWPVTRLMLDRPLWSEFKSVFVSIARTLGQMHECGYTHQDIHPSNILISEKTVRPLRAWWRQLGRPFGLSSDAPSFRTHLEGVVGDLDRVLLHDSSIPVPEYLDLLNPGHDSGARKFCQLESDRKKQDVYDLAHTIVQLMLGVARTNMQEAREIFKNANVTAIWPSKLVSVLRRALSDEPSDRPSMAQMAWELERVKWPSLARIRFFRLIGWGASIILMLSSLVLIGLRVEESRSSTSACGGFKCDGKLEGNLASNLTLEEDGHYLLSGLAYYEGSQGSKLTIMPGAKIYGESRSVLVIGPDANFKIGGEEGKVIFTSAKRDNRKSGDWGGVAVLGNSQAGSEFRDGRGYLEFCFSVEEGRDSRCYYGSSVVEGSSSGELSAGRGSIENVKIEYSGARFFDEHEVNGLTLAGVDTDVTVLNVEVSHTGDDCIEMFGGTVEIKNMTCSRVEDDCFDWDEGFSGKIYGPLKCDIKRNSRNTSYVFEGTRADEIVDAKPVLSGDADEKCEYSHPRRQIPKSSQGKIDTRSMPSTGGI